MVKTVSHFNNKNYVTQQLCKEGYYFKLSYCIDTEYANVIIEDEDGNILYAAGLSGYDSLKITYDFCTRYFTDWLSENID